MSIAIGSEAKSTGPAEAKNGSEKSTYSWMDVIAKSLLMAREVPDSGRISSRQVERVKAISDSF